MKRSGCLSYYNLSFDLGHILNVQDKGYLHSMALSPMLKFLRSPQLICSSLSQYRNLCSATLQ
jgi:hypothetical protein